MNCLWESYDEDEEMMAGDTCCECESMIDADGNCQCEDDE